MAHVDIKKSNAPHINGGPVDLNGDEKHPLTEVAIHPHLKADLGPDAKDGKECQQGHGL